MILISYKYLINLFFPLACFLSVLSFLFVSFDFFTQSSHQYKTPAGYILFIFISSSNFPFLYVSTPCDSSKSTAQWHEIVAAPVRLHCRPTVPVRTQQYCP